MIRQGTWKSTILEDIGCQATFGTYERQRSIFSTFDIMFVIVCDFQDHALRLGLSNYYNHL